MIGLTVLFTYLIYLLLSIGTVMATVHWARKRGRRPLLWGGLAALLMYHLVFWDLIPTHLVYNYYRDHKAGFWVYKTVEQWKAENPGVAETLTWRRLSPAYQSPGITQGYKLNERIAWVVSEHHTILIPVVTVEEVLLDMATGEYLVKFVKVYCGYRNEVVTFLKFWARHRESSHLRKNFSEIRIKYKMLGEERYE